MPRAASSLRRWRASSGFISVPHFPKVSWERNASSTIAHDFAVRSMTSGTRRSGKTGVTVRVSPVLSRRSAPERRWCWARTRPRISRVNSKSSQTMLAMPAESQAKRRVALPSVSETSTGISRSIRSGPRRETRGEPARSWPAMAPRLTFTSHSPALIWPRKVFFFSSPELWAWTSVRSTVTRSR